MAEGKKRILQIEDLETATSEELAENSLRLLSRIELFPNDYSIGDYIANEIALLQKNIRSGNMDPDSVKRGLATISKFIRGEYKNPLENNN